MSKRIAILAAVLLGGLLMALPALSLAEEPAQGSDRAIADAAVNWWVFGGAGGPATNDSTALNGTLGQSAIGPASSNGNLLGAGFWYRTVTDHRIYLPLVLRDY